MIDWLDGFIKGILEKGTDVDKIDLFLARLDFHADLIGINKNILIRRRAGAVRAAKEQRILEKKDRLRERSAKLGLRVLRPRKPKEI